jgi:hypothetical protein
MSDPVTNVEIEEVLSSIRRLVSDGDKPRACDPAAVEPAPDAAAAHAQSHEPPPESEPVGRPPSFDKFILTPAFMVVDSDVSSSEDRHDDGGEASVSDDGGSYEDGGTAHHDEPSDDDTNDYQDLEASHDDDVSDEGAFEDAAEDAPPDYSAAEEHEAPDADEAAEPLFLTGGFVHRLDMSEPASSRDTSDLVATIAERDAAFSTATNEYEPDGSEVASADTIAWPGAIVQNLNDVEDAQVETQASDCAAANVNPAAVPDEPEPEDAAEVEASDDHQVDPSKEDSFEDGDLDGLLDAGGVQLDEAALRELVADVVREELTGPLGERITRNVRKLVRREIYRILSSQELD